MMANWKKTKAYYCTFMWLSARNYACFYTLYKQSPQPHTHPVPLQCVSSGSSLTDASKFHKPQLIYCLKHERHGGDVTVGLDSPELGGVFSVAARNHRWEVYWWLRDGTQQGAVIRQSTCKWHAVHGRHEGHFQSFFLSHTNDKDLKLWSSIMKMPYFISR